MFPLHSIRAALAALVLALPLSATAQETVILPQLQETGGTNFSIFLGGTPIGSEQIAVSRVSSGWTIVSTGRLGAPLDAVARRLQVRYTPDWKPIDFSLDGTIKGTAQTVRTTVEGNIAKSELTIAGTTTPKTDTIDPSALLMLPNSFYGPYEALAARLKGAAPGTQIPMYLVPQGSVIVTIGATTDEQIQTTARLVVAHRTRFAIALADTRLDGALWTDDAGRMIRFSLPQNGLEVVREDIAAVSSRSVTISRPNDQPIKIPSNGFSLIGTMSRPMQTSDPRLPAVVLVGGTGQSDRDGLTGGVPVLGQISDALATAGYVVVRYDKRGIGQSGGRSEAASLTDYADDVRAAVKVLADRKDVDPKRITVIGYGEGGVVALMAAAKDKKIAAVGLLATPGITGADVILAQQKRMLDRSSMTAEEKLAKVDEQKMIHQAVITGKGLDKLPPNVRRSVDTPEFQSLLLSDPAKLMPEVRQPLLIVHGSLDTQVEPQNAEVLDALARKRKNAPPVETIKVAGVNHLFVPATTGESSEYASLPDKHVSPEVTGAIVTWLNKTPSPAR